ncbi:protein kintoun [Maniola jurtina]|uniref:protein kintoun n=1 Tax=Maniola jurtina TaxID=191418 RepID=UPI001E68D1EF|nr:protein kintoun [Maniola jurtina]
MATGVKPRDEESSLTKADLETIQDAMKSKKFRELLSEYCDEIRDPANQAIYQKEMTQLEKERGYDVTFINPKAGYVIKTSVAGDRKAFINICSNENVDKPSCRVEDQNGQKGMNWQLPYTIIPPREDFDHKRQRCVIYDVVFHPDTLRMAEVNKRFRELVNNTAFDGLQKTYNIHFDSNNCRFPKSYYKGMTTPAVIRKEDPNFKPPTDEEENEQITPEIMEKLYPQHMYPEAKEPVEEQYKKELEQHRKKAKNSKKEFSHASDNGYTVPKYVIKQQKNVDLQDFTYQKDSKQYAAMPSHIVVEINLPLLSSTKDCVLDVREKSLSLISEKPAKYKLNLTLPYAVNDECGNAKFDKSKHTLIVSLPVVRKNTSNDKTALLRADSGVESEENSNDEEESKQTLIEVISSDPTDSKLSLMHNQHNPPSEEAFLLSTISYTFPSYTYNALDDVIAFTFHVKNTEPDSVKVKNDGNKIHIKFSSLGSGFVPIHYAALISFDGDVQFDNVTGEAWDNNVILQLETAGAIKKFHIGLSENDLKTEYFGVSQTTKDDEPKVASSVEGATPLVEVTNLGTETNIVVSSLNNKTDTEEETENERDIVWTESFTIRNGAKSILRKPIMMRSFSESSVGDVASSMDYISSDCIPEESSLKKTVRFSDVIARQFYRYNSSIEGQKKKNQRKKSKKRNQERRRSESEAEDDISNLVKPSKPRLKSVLKQRHDSGLADTSDADECKNMSDSDLQYNSNTDENANEDSYHARKNTSYLNIINNNTQDNQPAIWTSDSRGHLTDTKGPNQEKHEPITCDNIKHNTDLYNPEKLNKGQYLEVKFKNDLIFDLDM